DPRRGVVALGDLRQRLQVLVRQQLLVGVAVVDRLEDGLDGPALALRGQDRGGLLALGREDRRLLVALGAQDRGLLLALGRQDRRLALTLGRQDRRALVTLGAHLLLHRV